MPNKKPRAGACPLPLATTQIARGLIRLHARLRGELLKSQEGEAAIMEPVETVRLLQHSEAILEFLRVQFEPADVRPIRSRPKHGPMGYGQVRREALSALKNGRAWMTCSEIADSIISTRRLVLTPAELKHFKQKLREALHALKGRGAVDKELALELGSTNVLQRWQLSQSMFG